MISQAKTMTVVAISVLALSGTAFVVEAMDNILDSAMPYMLHSCESVILTHEDDPQAVADIVELKVSLYNRGLVFVEEVEDKNGRQTMHAEFVEELEDACAGDPGMLLAGALDIAVKHTFAAFD